MSEPTLFTHEELRVMSAAEVSAATAEHLSLIRQRKAIADTDVESSSYIYAIVSDMLDIAGKMYGRGSEAHLSEAQAKVSEWACEFVELSQGKFYLIVAPLVMDSIRHQRQSSYRKRRNAMSQWRAIVEEVKKYQGVIED